MPVLRWGLLGTARINRLLIPAIRASRRSTVAAVASRDPARADAYAAAWEIPSAAPSYEALLASDLDVVYNALPNSLHVPWTLRALEAGKHVLCEKPLALTPEDVDRVAAAARRAGRIAAEGFMYRHHAITARVGELVRSGAIGELRAIAGGFTYLQSRQPDVRLDPALGGGALLDVGCYPVSYAQWLAGPARRVSASQQLGPTGVDVHVTATLEHADGVTTQVLASFRAAYQSFLHIVGTIATVELDRPFRPEPGVGIRVRRDGTLEEITVGGSEIFVDEVADMECAALGERPPRISLTESRALAATLGAIRHAAEHHSCLEVLHAC